MKLKKALPVRFINGDKYKHGVNKWITEGIKKTQLDQLYKVLKDTAQSDPSYAVRKQNLFLYNKILKFYKRSNYTLS